MTLSDPDKRFFREGKVYYKHKITTDINSINFKIFLSVHNSAQPLQSQSLPVCERYCYIVKIQKYSSRTLINDESMGRKFIHEITSMNKMFPNCDYFLKILMRYDIIISVNDVPEMKSEQACCPSLYSHDKPLKNKKMLYGK
jgi:hypothetical protein